MPRKTISVALDCWKAMKHQATEQNRPLRDVADEYLRKALKISESKRRAA